MNNKIKDMWHEKKQLLLMALKVEKKVVDLFKSFKRVNHWNDLN